MSLIKSAGAGEQSTGFYKLLLDQSLKFDDGDGQYLTRTPASAGNRKTFTYSSWVKRGKISADNPHWGMSAGTLNNTSNARTEMLFNPSDNIVIGFNTGSWYESTTDAKFRDTSAWYHFVVTVDMTQSTASDRLKFYVNGELQTFSSYSVPNQNTDLPINNTLLHGIGEYIAGESSASYQFDGYLAEINFIDGTALTADSFGETKDGIWIPKDTSGLTFGTNGFHLTFKDDVVSEGFNTVTYTGNGGNQAISGIGFQPDFVWVKNRDKSSGTHHVLSDSVRGSTGGYLRKLASSMTAVETNYSPGYYGSLTSIDGDGFSVGAANSDWQQTNSSGDHFVAWCWEAGTSFSNDASATGVGNVDSEGKTNTAKGFSIIKWTYSTSADNLIAHGLGAVPTWILIKSRTTAYNWDVYHSGLSAASKRLILNSTGAEVAGFFDTTPTSTVFEYNTSAATNGDEMIAYCWTDISGYSKFGSYTGSGSAGKQVTGLGFKPAWLMIKSTTVSGGNWAIWDNTRSVVDPRNDALVANGEDTEFVDNSSFSVDFLSDGFELNSNYGDVNQSSATYIYMAFADTREAAFFKDVTTNGNHWTPVNLDYRDSVPDVPTNNFATLNPLSSYSTIALSEGNLKASESANVGRTAFSSIALQSGKWYFEAYVQTAGSYVGIGLSDDSYTGSSYTGDSANSYGYLSHTGNKYNNGAAVSYGATFTAGDIVSAAFDVTTGTLTFYKNGASQGTAFTSISLEQFFTVTSRNGVIIANFGQDSSFAGNHATANSNADGNGHGSFAYAPPSGYLALCSQNLPTPDIIDGTENFNTVLYTGDGNSTKSISGVGFSPDWVWVKNRASTYDHALMDSVRGASAAYLSSNNTASESTYGNIYGDFTSFDSDGFSVAEGSDATYPDAAFNQSSEAYVAWNWLAGTAFSNDASATGVGTIDSSGQVNATAGFSIIKYTGTGSAGTIAHGLSAAPEFIICKNRSASQNWLVQGNAIGDTSAGNFLLLESTSAKAANNTVNTTLGSTTITLDTSATYNGSGNSHIMYAFHSVEGYSKVGSYTGNGNADGTFVYTGFRPAWVMVKTSSLGGQYWNIFDNVRDPFNDQNTQSLYPNVSDAEGTGNIDIDFLSNGMKMRDSGNNHNSSGHTYIFLAFADQPFKFANAR